MKKILMVCRSCVSAVLIYLHADPKRESKDQYQTAPSSAGDGLFAFRRFTQAPGRRETSETHYVCQASRE